MKRRRLESPSAADVLGTIQGPPRTGICASAVLFATKQSIEQADEEHEIQKAILNCCWTAFGVVGQANRTHPKAGISQWLFITFLVHRGKNVAQPGHPGCFAERMKKVIPKTYSPWNSHSYVECTTCL